MKVKCIKGFKANGLFELTFIEGNEYPLITDELNKKKFIQIGCFSVSYEHCKNNFEIINK